MEVQVVRGFFLGFLFFSCDLFLLALNVKALLNCGLSSFFRKRSRFIFMLSRVFILLGFFIAIYCEWVELSLEFVFGAFVSSLFFISLLFYSHKKTRKQGFLNRAFI